MLIKLDILTENISVISFHKQTGKKGLEHLLMKAEGEDLIAAIEYLKGA